MGNGFDISKIVGFDWDKGNVEKNKVKHNVNKEECEQIFSNKPLIIFEDEEHSKTETRFGAFGNTNKGRRLTMFFTVRNKEIRVISARNQSKREKEISKEIEEANTYE